MTRLPTKRMATACWAFIVAKRIPRRAAPLLDFGSLRDANMRIQSTAYPQPCQDSCQVRIDGLGDASEAARRTQTEREKRLRDLDAELARLRKLRAQAEAVRA